MPTGRLERKITLGILEQFSTISQMCSNWFHFVSLAHLNSFKCRSNNETWRYKCVEGHAGGFYTRWQWAGGGDAGWEALTQNPKSQNTQGCEGSWAPIYCHARETFRAQNYFKRYLKYPQSMGLRSMDFVFRLETHLLEISLWDLCKYLNIWKKKTQIQNTSGPKAFQIEDSQLYSAPLPAGAWERVFLIYWLIVQCWRLNLGPCPGQAYTQRYPQPPAISPQPY